MDETKDSRGALPEEFEKARNRALYYLQFSNKTESEMRKKLAEKDFSPASVEHAVNFLLQYRYLNDEDYARRYLEKNGMKKSRRQIVYELHQKGVSPDVVELALGEAPVDEEAQILSILKKRKYPGENAGREEKQKISGYLARKGFSYEAIASALNHYAWNSIE